MKKIPAQVPASRSVRAADFERLLELFRFELAGLHLRWTADELSSLSTQLDHADSATQVLQSLRRTMLFWNVRSGPSF